MQCLSYLLSYLLHIGQEFAQTDIRTIAFFLCVYKSSTVFFNPAPQGTLPCMF